MVGLLWTCDTLAQAESLETYALAPLQNGSLVTTWGSTPLEPGRYALGLGMQVRPLSNDQTAVGGTKQTGTISTLEFLATVGVWQRLDISGGLTTYNGNLDGSSSPDARSGAALGDVRLIPRMRLLGGDTGAGFALAVPVWFPAGNASAYRDQGLRFEPRALASYFSKRITLSANAGYLFSQPHEGLRQGWLDAITGSIGAEVPLLDTWSAVTELSSRWQLRNPIADANVRLPVEALAAGRFSIAGWIVQLGGAVSLRDTASQPAWRLIASVGFRAPEFPHSTPVATPSQADRTAREPDPCPSNAEAEAGHAVNDLVGCPLGQSEPALAPEEPVQADAEASPVNIPVEVVIESTLPPIREIVYFELNKMDLVPAQLAVLDAVEAQLRSAPPGTRLMIEGHSDGFGPPPFNSSLSRMRASTVRLYLIQRGISWRRLLITSYGSSRPTELGVDEAGRARNRRVEFRLIAKRRE